jgi:hypothetical protein
MPLYLSNTNLNQSLQGDVRRGAPLTAPGIISASYTTNTSSLFVITNDAVTRLSTTSSATTNFTASINSTVSASIAGTAISSSNSVTLFISASDGSLLYNQSTTGSALNTNFAVASNVIYTISSSVNEGTGSVIPTGAGLFRSVYNGYFADNTSFFLSSSAVISGADTGVLTTGTGSSATFFSVEWKGYFKPSSTETYSFSLATDDASYLWIGNSALAAAPTIASALINNGGIHGQITVTGSISLVSGSYYPMRIQYGDGGGGALFTASFQSTTIANTQNFTNYTFYNTSSNGF